MFRTLKKIDDYLGELAVLAACWAFIFGMGFLWVCISIELMGEKA